MANSLTDLCGALLRAVDNDKCPGVWELFLREIATEARIAPASMPRKFAPLQLAGAAGLPPGSSIHKCGLNPAAGDRGDHQHFVAFLEAYFSLPRKRMSSSLT